jgi:hypothetical protein
VLLATAEDISKELRAQYASITQIMVGETLVFTKGDPPKALSDLHVLSSTSLSRGEQKRIENWFKVRTKTDDVVVHFEGPTQEVETEAPVI